MAALMDSNWIRMESAAQRLVILTTTSLPLLLLILLQLKLRAPGSSFTKGWSYRKYNKYFNIIEAFLSQMNLPIDNQSQSIDTFIFFVKLNNVIWLHLLDV